MQWFKRGPFKALSMVGKSVLTNHKTVRERGGLILMAPHKNWTTALFLPTDRPAIEAWRGAMAAVKILMWMRNVVYPAFPAEMKEPLTHRR